MRNTVILLKQNEETVSNFETYQHNNMSKWLFLSSKLFDDSVTVFKAVHLVCVRHPSLYTESTILHHSLPMGKIQESFPLHLKMEIIQFIIMWGIPMWHINDNEKYEYSQLCNILLYVILQNITKHNNRQCKIFREIISHTTKQNDSSYCCWDITFTVQCAL